jgi:signal transduction histidine kinase
MAGMEVGNSYTGTARTSSSQAQSTGEISRRHRFDRALALGLALIAWAQLFLAQVASRLMLHVNPEGLEIATGFHQRSVWVTFLLATACVIPLIWRRDRPILVLTIVTAVQCVTSLWTHDPLLTFIAPLVAVYTVGRYVSTKRLIVITALVVCALVGVDHFAPILKPRVVVRQELSSTPSDERDFGRGDLMPGQRVPDIALEFINVSRGRTFVSMLQIVASVVACAALGRMTRLHAEYVLAAQQQVREAEHAREAEAARRSEEERLRIARELHDITGHSLAAIAVQAGAAGTLLQSDPVAAGDIVDGIRTTAQRSLDELRQVVGVLRQGGSATEGLPLTPEVSVRELDKLLRGFTDTGLPVAFELTEEGSRLAALPAAVGSAAYRIIQESLTNVLRHAQDAQRVAVHLTLSAQALAIDIENDGATPPVSSDATQSTIRQAASHPDDFLVASGHGLAGMRERAAALGGSFFARFEGADSFHVRAVLPL